MDNGAHEGVLVINKILKKFNILPLLLFFCLGFLTYSSSLNNPFVMDDEIQVIGNIHIQSLTELPSFFNSSTMDSGGSKKMGGIYYKPLMTSYYAIIWHFFGADPLAFRIPLLILHILSAYLVFLFSISFLSRISSLFVAVIFLLHPINTEVVLYIADAQDILYFFFGILSLCLIESLEKKKTLFTVLLIVFSFGLLSKETGGLFLIIGAAYTFFLRPKKIIPVFSSAAIIGLSYLFLRWQIGLTETKNPALIFHSASFLERLRMLPLILGHYIEIFFFPDRLSLTTDFVLQGYSLELFWIPLIITLIFLIIFYKISRNLFSMGHKNITLFFLSTIFFWFVLHGQMLIPLDGVYADRWFYIGVWVLTSLLVLFLSHIISVRNLSIALTFISLLFGFRSYAHSLDWQDPLILYQRELAMHPWDAIMANNVGVMLFRKQLVQESESYFTKATQLNPNWNVAWNNLGAVKEQQQKFSDALELYLKSLQIAPYPLAYENYAKLLIKTGEKEKAYQFLKLQALPLYPYNKTLLEFKNYLFEQVKP